MAWGTDMLVRLGTAIFGLAALIWAGAVWPVFQNSSGPEGMARQIISGETFKRGVLAAAVAGSAAGPASGPVYSPRAHAEAVIRLRLLEEALEGADGAAIDARAASLKTSIAASLRLAPCDSFLYLALFWLENTQNGFAPENLEYLDFSYATGAREGWIAGRRNKLALALFDRLAPVSQDRVVAEFAAMVNDGFTRETALNLTGPGWPVRELLLAALSDVDTISKQALAKLLSSEGIRVSIPGIETNERPWFR